MVTRSSNNKYCHNHILCLKYSAALLISVTRIQEMGLKLMCFNQFYKYLSSHYIDVMMLHCIDYGYQLEKKDNSGHVLDSLPPFPWSTKQYLEPEHTVGHI
jgi:hypothetical protein